MVRGGKAQYVTASNIEEFPQHLRIRQVPWANGKMKSKIKIIVERGPKKYEVLFDYECTKVCSFRHADENGICEGKCHLPSWFQRVVEYFNDWNVCLREIKEDKRKGKR